MNGCARDRVEKIIAAAARTNSNKAAGPLARTLRDLFLPTAMKLLAKPEKMAWQYGYRIDWDPRWAQRQRRSGPERDVHIAPAMCTSGFLVGDRPLWTGARSPSVRRQADELGELVDQRVLCLVGGALGDGGQVREPDLLRVRALPQHLGEERGRVVDP